MNALLVAFLLVGSASPSTFLRDYVSALCAEKTGDHAKAVALMQPYETASNADMRAAARDFPVGQFKDASVQASWPLVLQNWSTRSWNFVVSKHERREAVDQLRQCFGANVTDGPMNGQPQLEAGAATMAWFLTHDVEKVQSARDMWRGH